MRSKKSPAYDLLSNKFLSSLRVYRESLEEVLADKSTNKNPDAYLGWLREAYEYARLLQHIRMTKREQKLLTARLDKKMPGEIAKIKAALERLRSLGLTLVTLQTRYLARMRNDITRY